MDIKLYYQEFFESLPEDKDFFVRHGYRSTHLSFEISDIHIRP